MLSIDYDGDGVRVDGRWAKKGVMAQEHSNSSSGSGGAGGGGGNNNYPHHHHHNSNRSQKKMKQKKVPQRGLGVAQLEKIRMEEQKKKGVVLLSPSNSSSCLSVQCPPPPPPAFRPSMISTNSSSSALAPLNSSSPSDLPSPNSLFRTRIPPPPPPHVDVLNPVRFPKSLNVGNGEMGWPVVPFPTGHGIGGGTWPKVWSNGEYGFVRDQMDHHHQGFAYRPNMNLPFESGPPTPFIPIPNGLQRSHQFPQQSSSSMTNISSGISPSSILNFQTEPPSNQNLCPGSNYTPLWPDEEKMAGMKRPYPFAMETPPAPSFHFKYTPCSVASVPKSEESNSGSNTCTVNTDPGIRVIREGPLRSSALLEQNREIKATKNGILNGDFLSLAPPAAAVAAAAAPHLSSQYASSQFNSDGSLPEQASSKPIRPPFYSFFPIAKNEVGQVADSSCNRNGEIREKVDLSLKL